MKEFVHLSVHSEFSVVDGLIKIKPLALQTAELGMPAVALTDLANLFGLVKFYGACHANGVKPIVGADFRYRDPDTDDVNRCLLLAMHERGYKNLLTLISRTYTDAAERGCAERAWIFDAADDLMVLSGARDGDVGRALLAADEQRAERLADDWAQVFEDRYYLELQRTGRADENTYLAAAVDLAGRKGLPVVATNDVRFLDRDDFEAHETRVCIQEGRTLNDPRRDRNYTEQQYLKSADEMAELFSDLPEALTNSVEIAKRCNLHVELGTYYLPNYPIPEGSTLEEFLDQSADSGLETRLEPMRQISNELDEVAYRERLAFELNVIKQMGFAGYFLIVAEFVTWAKQNDVPVGPGRGSGAGSLVAYALGITDVDPLRYDLLFERLLNPERVSMPDFDIDFCMEGRDKVIAHVADRYGHEAVSQIITFGTMAAKAVVRDVARVQGKPYGLADKLSKLIPFEVGMTLEKAVEQEPELEQFIAENDDVAEIMDMAYKLEGTVRNVGKHAGGVVIAPSALTDFVPLFTDEASGGVVSQFDKDDVEAAGLVKFDFLGLKTLTIIDWALNAVNETRAARGESLLDIQAVALGDPATYEFLKTAETTAIFQLESQGMKELIRKLLPDNIEDIIALVALFRPGPLQSGAVDQYIDRKHGREPVAYAHPRLADVLEGTYGVMLYQEHVMTGAQVLAGFSLGQADLLRRAMGKKKPEEMAKMREMFTDGADAEGVDARVANAIFDDMEKFAGYAFNKSHSAAYALVTFQTAWLKTHYPAEFMAAVLSADMQNIDKVVTLVDEVRRMGLTLRPPDVNSSAFRFVAVDGEILYGLGAVRGVGEGPVDAIVSERQTRGEFISLDDFCMRIDQKRAGKRVLEALTNSGAMDSLYDGDARGSVDQVRADLQNRLPTAMKSAEQSARDLALGMNDMFGGPATRVAETAMVRAEAWNKRQRLEGEKDTLGLYLTGHPIDDYVDEIRRFCPTRIADLRVGRGKQVVAGLLVSNRIRRNRRGDAMAFTVLDDRSGRIEASVFGEVLESNRAKLFKDAVLIFDGEIQPDDYSSGLKMRAESILTIEEARTRFARCLEISVREDALDHDFSDRLKSLLEPHRSGGCAVAVAYRSRAAEGRLVLGQHWRVLPCDDLLQGLRDEFGSDQVVMSYG